MKNSISLYSLVLNVILICLLVAVSVHFKHHLYNWLTKKGTFEIVMFGDSITENCDWHPVLRKNNIRNSGARGFTAGHMLNTIEDKVLKHDPKLCFLMVGINDINSEIPLAVIKRNYSEIVEVLILNDIRPILQATLYIRGENDAIVNAQVDSLNSFLTQLSYEKQIPFIDVNKLLSSDKRLNSEYTTDGLHLNQDAYNVWLAKLEEFLENTN